MKRHQKGIIWTLLVVVALVSAGSAVRSDTFFQIKKNFTIFSEVFQEVTLRYVDEVEPEKLIRKGINSMLETLDPYTVLIDEAENQNLEILTTGSYAGVGIEVGARAGKLVVVAPIEGHSAFRRGVRAGDVILRVDGISVDGFSVDDLQSLITGEPGSTVVLTIERFGFDEPIDFELTREKVEVRNITYAGYLDAEQGVGYVSLARFGQNAGNELRGAILELKEKGTLNALVIDLRNNPGGLLDEAVRIVDLFIPAGKPVVRTQGRGLESSFTARTELPVLYDGPLAVMLNNGSASASEIVAGALQDYDRALVTGSRSFGKGLVQQIRPLSYNTSIKITTSRYYIPSGRSIQSALYSPEDADESVQLPDSLRRAFQTDAGRTVYDGVGIEPDVAIAREHQTLVEVALLRNSAYFFFANEYRSENETFNRTEVDDELFTDFQEYLIRSGFSYESRAQRYLNQLEEQLAEGERDALGGPLDTLREHLSKSKFREMEQADERIRRQLYLELLSRYEGESGRLRASLSNDPVVLKTLDILSDAEQLTKLLQP